MTPRPTRPAIIGAAAVLGSALVFALPAFAQSVSVDLGNGPSSTGRIVQIIALLTVLFGSTVTSVHAAAPTSSRLAATSALRVLMCMTMCLRTRR